VGGDAAKLSRSLLICRALPAEEACLPLSPTPKEATTTSEVSHGDDPLDMELVSTRIDL
jgi:hypothetical protein